MILPDVNVLVYAFRREAPEHDRYRRWLSDLASGADELALAEVVLAGFLRIVTNPRILSDPAPIGKALGFVDTLRSAPRSSTVSGTDAAWALFADLAVKDRQIRGNPVPDAWIAALAGSHGCRVATADRGFARYGVDWFDPAT